MPAHGDQHKPNGPATQNPFEEQKPQISNYTAQEIATLASRLNQRLGPEYIATRAGPGNSRVAYLPAEKAINLANEVFGFNGWSSSIQNIQIDFVDENPTKGTISIGLSVVVRITLKDGTYHEDTGYGGIENCKSKIAAFEKAKKEGTTDALKRALRNFGNVLGNCVYDKEYITKVSKIKTGAGKWDVNDLYRHQDWVPKKEEEPDKKPISNTLPPQPPNLVPEESFDTNEFDDADFADLGNPDEVMLPPDSAAQRRAGPQHAGSRLPVQHHMTPSKPPQHRPDQRFHDPQPNGNRQPPHLRNGPTNTTSHVQDMNHPPQSRSSSPGVASQHFAPLQPPAGPQSVGFFSAKAADNLDGNNNPTGSTEIPKFNPYAESPSIRKTSGVDHSKSLALNRNTLKPEPLPSKEESEAGGGVAKTSAPMTKAVAEQPAARRMPGPGSATMSPRPAGVMTSAYRPPTRHGPTGAAGNGNSPAAPNTGERMLTAAKRPPLSDLSNVQQNASADGGDTKRQRIGPGLSGNSADTMPG